jgi:fungal STAND N-terminal Goodbye domain
MSQSPAPGSSPNPPTSTVSSPDFQLVFEKAKNLYKKKTKQDLATHPLATELGTCDSPAAILAVLQKQVDQFNQSRSSDERLHRWLSPTINVLQAFSGTLGAGIGMVNISWSLIYLALIPIW